MFTGIIEAQGTLRKVARAGEGMRLCIEAGFSLDEVCVGDSIAINGVCLTVVSISGRIFEVDVAPETLSKTTLMDAKQAESVNLERALRLSDRIDGHLVSGHVDGIGTVRSRRSLANAILIGIDVPEDLGRYIVRKGSIAVDGVSLTVNRCDSASFEVSIIPHTAEITTIGRKKIGGRVNIETDMIGKYVERFVKHYTGGKEGSKPPVDMELLTRTGFI
ncbi:MAG: riboflavin synthase [Deltaproteobacteria bacterium]|jgi:riboflavin synthase|nr:riboflavin synthase [Deltaproteobacteria bacterium]